MNPNTAIIAHNISKQYRLGEVGTGTITHDLNRAWAKLRGKEDPFLKIGESNDRTSKGESDYVWSLKDINFEIEKGDAVGIIGRNGAGKSTLLKLLSRVTKPTTGHFEVQGRIASLLEVGTGFNPEMTGRENIFLNGAILGMRRNEIKRKFDEIVDFAGVERYIDTPVKRYSSGMYVRLAFAVAAHLESEILIVDEVLAVGDAEFQKKCLGKMGDVSKGEGRTVLFVSHNMAAVNELCNSGILLDEGLVVMQSDVNKIIVEYQKKSGNISDYNSAVNDFKIGNHNITVNKFTVSPVNGDVLNIKSGARIEVCFTSRIKNASLDISFFLRNSHEITVLSTGFMVSEKGEMGDYNVCFEIPANTLNEDGYYFDMFWGVDRSEIAFKTESFGFEIHGNRNHNGGILKSPGVIFPEIKSEITRIS